MTEPTRGYFPWHSLHSLSLCLRRLELRHARRAKRFRDALTIVLLGSSLVSCQPAGDRTPSGGARGGPNQGGAVKEMGTAQTRNAAASNSTVSDPTVFNSTEAEAKVVDAAETAGRIRQPLESGGLAPEPCELSGLHNVFRLTHRIYSGSEPQGDEAFAALAELGIQCIVSVDGGLPDVERARRFGIRYIHIPIGYDGVPHAAQAALTRLVRETTTPLYLHCHHGKHRGPAAAAVACVAVGATDGSGALTILHLAGTSKDYGGLWRDVAEFVPLGRDAPLPELQEVAPISTLAASMAVLDRSFDNLRLCRDADWQTPPAHPDLIPQHEALLVYEALHEAARHLNPGSDERFDQTFVEWLSAADRSASRIHEALAAQQPSQATAQFGDLENSCRQCHRRYRDQ